MRKRVSRVLKVVSLVLAALALTAIFTIGLGVDRYARGLAIVMDTYASAINILFGALVDNVAEFLSGWAISWLSLHVEIRSHWKDVFTFMTLYAFADAAQFFGRKDADGDPAAATRRVPLGGEKRMAATSLVVGFVLSLAAAAIVGMTPLDRSWASTLTLVLAPVAALFLYWQAIALAHAAWNRWNYAQGTKQPLESFGRAFRLRSLYALRRCLGGAAFGLILAAILRAMGVAVPGMVALGLLTLGLGLFWIYRAWISPRVRAASVGAERRGLLTAHDNFRMGADIVIKVVAGGLLAATNAVVVAD